MISAIVLAAGESRRMGQIKQLLDWGGKPLLGHVLDSLRSSPVDEIILVLGYEAERILERVATPQVRVVLNPHYQSGMLSSLKQGLKEIHPHAEGFLIVLADQPEIPPGMIRRLIDEFRSFRPAKSIVVPAYRGRRGHPALFGVKYRAEILQMSGETGAREILARHPDEVLTVEMGQESVIIDVDTEEDYVEYRKRSRISS
jgi:molybdenum cofactor cytidylyltransferase